MFYKKGLKILIAIISFFAFSKFNTVLADELENPIKIQEAGLGYPNAMVSLGSLDYFTQYSDEYGYELYKTDGTPGGKFLVKDIYSGSDGSDISNLYVINNKLYFYAKTDEYGFELWQSDGTESGTVILKDIMEGSDSSQDGMYMFLFDNILYFLANDGSHGKELWRSDGTESGTYMLKDINPGEYGSDVLSAADEIFFTMDDKLYFFNFNGDSETELWVSDGTETGTKVITTVPYKIASTGSRNSTQVFNDNLYFIINNEGVGTDLWRTDGTAEGTEIVQYDEDNGLRAHSSFRVYKNKLYFTAYDNVNWFELYTIDTNDEVRVINSGIFEDIEEITSITKYNNLLYFSDSYGNLYETDGTIENSKLIKDFSEDGFETYIYDFKIYNGRMYFLRGMYEDGGDNNLFSQLWESDGTEEGTKMIGDYFPIFYAPIPYFVTDIGIYYGKALNYMDFGDSRIWISDIELWKYSTVELETQKETYTVTFKDYNGSTLKTETVEEGESAIAPSSPKRKGYIFKAWDKKYNNITTNLTVTAIYEKDEVVKTTSTIENEEEIEEPVLEINSITSTLTETEVDNYNFIIQEKANGKTLVDVYDINLLLKGQKVQPDGTLEIRILMTDKQKNYENLEVLYIDDNNNVTVMPHTIDGNYIVFTVNHLSKYVLVGDVKENETPVVDDLDDKSIEEKGKNISPIIYAGIGALILIIIIIIFVKRKKNSL